MKAAAFAPGHISGFFEPVYHPEDLSRSGSRGAGLNILHGAFSEVYIESSNNQIFEIYINNRKATAPVTNLALKYLVGDKSLKILVKTKITLPIGQGFGMSAAGALSTTLAATKILGLSNSDAIKASHFAEIKLQTGLGDVLASSFGGLEIRKTPGLPPWGLIEHIPCKSDIVLCIIGKKVDTKKVLTDEKKMKNIIEYGRYCTKKILERPSIENFFYLSQVFTNKTGFADKKIVDAINTANNFGKASMCMLGNSIFALGNAEDLMNALSSFGKILITSVDENGARIITD